MPSVNEIAAFLEHLAPRNLAEDWDNVGLLVGDRQSQVERLLTCLTLTPDVAEEALTLRAQLIVSHHPILFRPVQKLTSDDPQGKMLLQLITGGIAVYSPHTSYDSAAGGINQQLAELLGLTEIAPLRPEASPAEYALVCYVPENHRAVLQEALWLAGAGKIGDYSRCSFFHTGTGTFLGSESSNPTIGQAGEFEEVAEVRLEVKVGHAKLHEVLTALAATHPYEEPAYFIHPLEASPLAKERTTAGTGRFGRYELTPAPTLTDVLKIVKQKLGIKNLGYVGNLQQAITKVGIACGAGGELLRDAAKHKCDVFLTGETRFHSLLEAREQGMALIVAGHYATERPAVERLAEILANHFPDLKAEASRRESDPLEWF